MQDNIDRDAENSESLASNKQDATPLKIVPSYQIYLENRRRKETVLFSRISVVLVILLGFSALLASGILPLPFLDNFSEKIHYAETGDTPCPIGDQPLKPKKIKVAILNGTDINKLATKTGASLKTLKFQIISMANADNPDYSTPALILTSPKLVDQAYTLGLALPNSKIQLGHVNELTVILGQGFTAPLEQKEFNRLLNRSFDAPKSCLPVK